MNFTADVVIVGAGPGGALLGYLLAKKGVSTIVLERHKGIDKEFRGEHLNKEGESLLKKYGLYEKVEKAGLLLMDRVEYWDRGHVIKNIFPADGEKHVGIHVPQRNLLSVLMEESFDYENYRLMMGTKVTGLILDENGRVAGVHAHDGTKKISIRSSVVAGADGRFSTVRKLAELPFETIRHGYDLLWAKISSPPGWEPTIKNALVGGRRFSLFTQAGGWIQIGWNTEEGSYPHLKKQSFAPFIEKAIEAFPELEETLQEHIQSWDDFILLKVQSCHCPAWVKDGLAIMGDAAHTMSPTGAFGINCALADASVLSEVIIEALQFHDVGESQLRKFEHARRAETEKLQREQAEKEAQYRDHFEVFAMAH